MDCFFNFSCCCVGFIIHYFLVFTVKVMFVFPAMISSFVSSGISSSYSSGVFFSSLCNCLFRFPKINSLTVFAVIFIDNVLPFVLGVQDLLHVIEVYVVMVIEDSFELITCAFHIWKVDSYWCYLFLIFGIVVIY